MNAPLYAYNKQGVRFLVIGVTANDHPDRGLVWCVHMRADDGEDFEFLMAGFLDGFTPLNPLAS